MDEIKQAISIQAITNQTIKQSNNFKSNNPMPLLSICIPTYNRCAALKASLEATTSDPAFLNHDDIEIVISDNASPDDTEKVCRIFAERFPQKILYHRQPVNKGYSANLETLTKLARGEYIKFINDCLAFMPGVIAEMRDIVKSNLNDKRLLFWGGDDFALNGPYGLIYCKTADEFLDVASHATTWVGAYGFWRQDIAESMTVNSQYAKTLIPQTAVFWHLFAKYGKAMVYHKPMVFAPFGGVGKGGYNIAEVFGKNYLKILRDYMPRTGMTKRAYAAEKFRVFKNIVYPWYFDFTGRKGDGFIHGNYFRSTIDYHWNFYFWFSFVLWPVFWLNAHVRKILPGSVRAKWLSKYRSIQRLLGIRTSHQIPRNVSNIEGEVEKRV